MNNNSIINNKEVKKNRNTRKFKIDRTLLEN